MGKWDTLKTTLVPYLRRVVKPAKDYNLEARTDAVLDKEKASPSPIHPTSKRIIDEKKRAMSEVDREKIGQVDPALLERLKSVYLTSTKDHPQRVEKDSRPLPTDRSVKYFDEEGYPTSNFLGVTEPDFVPEGKASLQTIQKFITDHGQSPSEWTAEKIAKEYKLDLTMTKNILKYFNTFRVIIPRKQPKKRPHALTRGDYDRLTAILGYSPNATGPAPALASLERRQFLESAQQKELSEDANEKLFPDLIEDESKPLEEQRRRDSRMIGGESKAHTPSTPGFKKPSISNLDIPKLRPKKSISFGEIGDANTTKSSEKEKS